MTIKALYPTVRPTLNLDFAKTKALDPRVTFTRASTATFVGADGLIQTAASGAARFDHNPATRESLGLLVEEARTNIALYSEQFDNGYWQGTSFDRTSNAAVAPDGTVTADKIAASNGVTSNNFTPNRVFSGLSGSTTGSVYVKYAGWQYVRLGGYVLDLLSTQNGTNSTYIGNGWHRLYQVYSTATIEYGINVTAITPGQSYTGNGTDGIFIWGAQVEAGSFPTSYIPTTTATVTRAADVASMTGTNFSSWYNQSQGTVVHSGRFVGDVPTGTYGRANSLISRFSNSGLNSFTNQWVIGGHRVNGASFPAFLDSTVYNGTTAQALRDNSQLFNVPVGGMMKVGGCIDNLSGSCGHCLNGGSVTSMSITNTPAWDTFSFTTAYDSSSRCGTIARLAYYPVRLPDTQLQALTAT